MKQPLRFPRIEGITGRIRTHEKLIHRTYNRMAATRNSKLRQFHFDIYKLRKGRMAPFWFLVLAKELNDRNIDPILYLKVMSQYGKFENAKWMPPPSWFCHEDTLNNFEWLYAKRRNKFQLKKDWYRSLRGYREKDIFKALSYSSDMVKKAQRAMKLDELHTVIMLLSECNPWFLSAYLGCTPARVSQVLMPLLKARVEVYEPVMSCLRHFRQNKSTWRHAKHVLQREMA